MADDKLNDDDKPACADMEGTSEHACAQCDHFPEDFRPVCKAVLDLNTEISETPHDERWVKYRDRLEVLGMGICSAIVLCTDSPAQAARRLFELFSQVTGADVRIASMEDVAGRGRTALNVLDALPPEMKAKLVKSIVDVIKGEVPNQSNVAGKVH